MAEPNIRALLPSEYVRIVNSTTEVGPEATTRKRCNRMRESYGMRVTDAQGRIDLLRVLPIRWELLKSVLGKPKFDKAAWERKRDRERREKQADIGEIPGLPDSIEIDGKTYSGEELRQQCIDSLEVYARTMYPKVFHLEWCEDHYTLCEDLQQVITHGGKRAKAYQRGFGKTAWCKVAIEWGIVTGRVGFALLISKAEGEAIKIRAGMLRRLQTNKRLRQLFPEVGWVMWKLSKNPRQQFTYKGEPLKVQKLDDMIILPCIEGSLASEAILQVSGIDGSVRGAHFDTSDGRTLRPTHVLIDDPQDEKAARNPETVKKIVETIEGAVEELSGPDTRMALFMPCTCIKEGDVASQFTDRLEKPTYLGVRQPAMDAMPTCLDPENTLGLEQHWTKYAQIRAEDLVLGDEEHENATDYYRRHREEMSHGAEVRWKARIEHPCIDALQFLMNKYLDKPDAFFAEYQQDPVDKSAGANYLSEDQMKRCFNGIDRMIVPRDVTKVVASIDIQEHVLYWMIVGWADDMTCYILGFGTTPDQPPGRFAHNQVQRRISEFVSRLDPENPHSWESERGYAIEKCCDFLMEPLQRIDSDADVFVDTIMIDARWEKINKLCLRIACKPKYRGILVPSCGQYVSPDRIQMSRAKMTKGKSRADRSCEWVMENIAVELDSKWERVKQVSFDANHYRTQVQKGLAKNVTKDGKPQRGRISFFGKKPQAFLASHLTAKRVELKEGSKRSCEVWTNKVNRDQDHWLDDLVMCRVGAEYAGLRVDSAPTTRTGEKKQRKQMTQDDVPFRPK